MNNSHPSYKIKMSKIISQSKYCWKSPPVLQYVFSTTKNIFLIYFNLLKTSYRIVNALQGYEAVGNW